MTFVPVGGLANRMRSTLSAIALARQTEGDVEIVWFQDWALHAAFHDLFSPLPSSPNVRIKEASAYDLWMFDRPRRKNFYVPALFQRLIFDARLYEHQIDSLRKSGFDFAEWAGRGRTYLAAYVPFYPYPPHLLREVFRPVPEVQAVIDRRCADFSPYTIGVHVRRTDNTLSTEYSPLELFFARIDEELAAHDDLCVYLATDSEEVKQAMRRRYAGRLVCAENEADRSSTQGIREGVADLFTLARTRKIYGSFYSSFSELAAELGGVPLEVVRK